MNFVKTFLIGCLGLLVLCLCLAHQAGMLPTWADEPATPKEGYLRVRDYDDALEFFDGNDWQEVEVEESIPLTFSVHEPNVITITMSDGADYDDLITLEYNTLDPNEEWVWITDETVTYADISFSGNEGSDVLFNWRDGKFDVTYDVNECTQSAQTFIDCMLPFLNNAIKLKAEELIERTGE